MRVNSRLLAWLGPLTLMLFPATGPQAAQAPPSGGQASAASASRIEVLEVRPGIFMLVGPHGNAVAHVGDDGILLVNTLSADDSGELRRTLDELSGGRRVRRIINTSGDSHNIGGNSDISARSENPLELNAASVQSFAHENVYLRMARPGPDSVPASAWPTDPYPGASTDLHFNGTAVNLYHAPAAHSDGDSLVMFRSPDVLVAGDVLLTTGYPVIDTARGGSVDGLIGALNRILELTVTAFLQEGGTLVVPGKGRISDESEVVEYRDMLVIVRGRIKDMIDRGLTLTEVQAARPTADYDPVYGGGQENWTTAMFVESVYRTLGGK